MPTTNLKNIAIFGASGNLGIEIVNSLLAIGKHNITAITRSNSSSTFPPSTKVIKGDLNDLNFLRTAFRGQQVVINCLSFSAESNIDENIISAAGDENVSFIIPNEFSSQDRLRKEYLPMMWQHKLRLRKMIEDLGKSKWIAVVNGTWYDFSLKHGYYQIDIRTKHAKIWGDGNTKANVTTLPKVGKSIAALLSLPPSRLERYAFKSVYFSSFLISQREILNSVQKATGTIDKDWKIESQDVHEFVRNAKETVMLNPAAPEIATLVYAVQFLPSASGDYEVEHGTVNEELGLKREDFDEVTKRVVDKVLGEEVGGYVK